MGGVCCLGLFPKKNWFFFYPIPYDHLHILWPARSSWRPVWLCLALNGSCQPGYMDFENLKREPPSDVVGPSLIDDWLNIHSFLLLTISLIWWFLDWARILTGHWDRWSDILSSLKFHIISYRDGLHQFLYLDLWCLGSRCDRFLTDYYNSTELYVCISWRLTFVIAFLWRMKKIGNTWQGYIQTEVTRNFSSA